MPFNANSLKNLGKPKTIGGRCNFTLSRLSIECLERQKNKSKYVDRAIITSAKTVWPVEMHEFADLVDGMTSSDLDRLESALTAQRVINAAQMLTELGFCATSEGATGLLNLVIVALDHDAHVEGDFVTATPAECKRLAQSVRDGKSRGRAFEKWAATIEPVWHG